MKSRDIRKAFLGYFEERGHAVLPSSSVIPHGDRTLLFTNAGMNQFKDVFTGKAKAPAPRAATVQKCIRAGGKHNDLDNVGYTARHLTFFEMLGNFSFGDYFKEGAIGYAWEFLTHRIGLDAGKLWVTVFHEDDEARRIWREKIGVPGGRIVGLGEKDNYWSMGDVGPCGPCSEILLDRGGHLACGPGCGIGQCDCDRFFEIWNLVFMQFDQDGSGSKRPLKKPCIDTGMGVERLAMVLQGANSVFETDVLAATIRRLEDLSGVPAAGDAGIPHRVIADHVRALVFAFADGAEPSNEGRGYVLRRILRRAARYGRKLRSSAEPLICQLVETVLAQMEDAYPEIRRRQAYIEGVIRSEEERFGRTLDQGLEIFEEMVGRLRQIGGHVIPGTEVFLLHDTYGFPADLVQQMAAELDLGVDLEAFEAEMQAQKQRSRAADSFSATARGGSADRLEVDRFPETRFVGYREHACAAELFAAERIGDSWALLLSQSPFYAEAGGQVGDRGLVEGDDVRFEVDDTRKDRGRWVHVGRVVAGDAARLRPGAVVQAAIDSERRALIERNHTATHLLHAALRRVLGDHVHQKGSLVESARLRFDITHFSGVRPEERAKVEELVLDALCRNLEVETFETDYEDAVKRGAMALFGEKYGDRVRVVRIGDFSMELCGGTHVRRTGDIGAFALTGEGSVSAGVRRLEAVTSMSALEIFQRNARLVEALSLELKAPPQEVLDRVHRLQDELKRLRAAKPGPGAAGKEPGADAGAVQSRTLDAKDGPIELVQGLLEDAGMKELLAAYDRVKGKTPRAIFTLLARQEGKVQALVAVSPALVGAGWDAREVFAPAEDMIGARGGGRPEMLRGGGTRPEGAKAALDAMADRVKAKLA
jgi:alanyl-tRNA synthetase